MRNLLALIGFMVVLFAGLGWYFNWYTFNIKASTDGKVNIVGDVDTKKMTDDARKFGEKFGNAVQNTAPLQPQPVGFMGPPLPSDMPSMPSKPATGTTIHLQVPAPNR